MEIITTTAKQVLSILNSSEKKSTDGRKYLTRGEIMRTLKIEPDILSNALEVLKKQEWVTFSNNEVSEKSWIYFTPKKTKDRVVESIKKIDAFTIIKKIINPMIIIPIIGTFISSYYTYQSIVEVHNIYIRVLSSFIYSVMPALILTYAFLYFHRGKHHLAFTLLLVSIAPLIFNFYHSSNYFYQNYESNRTSIGDINTIKYQSLMQRKKILIANLEDNKKLYENYNKQNTAGANYRMIEISSKNSELYSKIENIDKDISKLELTAQENKKSIFESLSQILGVNETLIFFIYSILPSIILDLITPFILAINSYKLLEK